MMNKIICGDALSVLKGMESESIDLFMTSPPYYRQRMYGNIDGEIGNESEMNEYLDSLLSIFGEMYRCAKNTGSIVFNIGDKYIDGGLSLLPYRFAMRAVDEYGVSLINTILWSKTNPTPRQDKRKLVQAHEPFFIFAKNPKQYKFNIDDYLIGDLKNKKIKKERKNIGASYRSQIDGSNLSDLEKENAHRALTDAIEDVSSGRIDDFRMKIRDVHKEAFGGQEGGRNREIRNKGFSIIRLYGRPMKKDVLETAVANTKGIDHPAVYPTEICDEIIKLLTDEGDIVCDTFCGSGSTCVSSKKLNRRYIGIDINERYVDVANKRLSNV